MTIVIRDKFEGEVVVRYEGVEKVQDGEIFFEDGDIESFDTRDCDYDVVAE